MAWNPSKEVADCRELAKRWNVDKVIVLGIDDAGGVYKMASYGRTTAMCEQAKKTCIYISDKVRSGDIPV